MNVFSQDRPDTIMPHECSPCTESWERECYTQHTNVHTFPSLLSALAHQDICLDEAPKRQEVYPIPPSEKGVQQKGKLSQRTEFSYRFAPSLATTLMPGSAGIGVEPSLVLVSPVAMSISISIFRGTGKNSSGSLGTGGRGQVEHG